ncbi:MAG: helicase-related protein [Planctomycetota bacterium]
MVLDHRVLGEGEPVGGAELRPRVTPIPGIAPGIHRRLLDETLARASAAIEDPLPAELRRVRGLPDLASALRAIHLPETPEEVGPAEERLLYHGFLAAALRVESGRGDRGTATSGPVVDIDGARDGEIRAAFPFALTAGQSAAVDAIRADLVSPRPMRRLLQGDVGCGKTAVAIWAALAVARAGAQAAILAPTETLARQFHAELARAAATFGLEALFLSGSARRADRRRAEDALAAGEILLAVGTTAILSERSPFARLALAVVDEQHRFGVLQRLRLVQKAIEPNLLAMSATPIPRTLALSLFSDLDHSEIRERPPGRAPVRTLHHVEERDGAFPWSEIADAARAGEKAFIVFPAIESETESIPSLLREGREIARRHFRGVPMAALHGRMTDEEKAENLARFRAGDVRVLFATTVIEVGVDVPDARTIAILGASRFGLAQLHQLRGRVGRGGQGGTCVLLTRTRESAESERLQTLVDCDDGFAIAERDLDLRGPGDMMGLRQHGLVALARRRRRGPLHRGLRGRARASSGAPTSTRCVWRTNSRPGPGVRAPAAAS